MKKIISIGIISFLLLSTNSFSQTISLPADSVAKLLCKKWEVNYAILGNMKIERSQGAPEINYEFNKDKTFLMTTKDPKDKTKGTWVYDAKKKIIKLTVNRNNNVFIIALKEGELIMLPESEEVPPKDPMEMKVIYKVKTN